MIGKLFKLKDWQWGTSAHRFVTNKETDERITIPIGSHLILTDLNKFYDFVGDKQYRGVTYSFLFGDIVINLIRTVGRSNQDEEITRLFAKCFDLVS